MAGIIEFKTDEPQFSDFIRGYAAAAMVTFDAAFEAQGRELCGRMIKFTPPLSGQSIKRGLWSKLPDPTRDMILARNEGDQKRAFAAFQPFNWRNTDVEDMSAKAVGERRVEKDIRRVIKGVKGAAMPRQEESPTVIVSQTNPRSANHDVQIDWGVRQKCQGRDAIRIYADKRGNVYGVDTEKFLPNPSGADLSKIHNEHRGKRGRVTTAGSKDLIVGRWRWLNIVVAPEANVQAYIDRKKLMVGQGKGGWAAGFKGLGGKISERGWIGRHVSAGTLRGWPSEIGGVVNITITNNSAWASNGDPDRVVQNAMSSRERDLEKLIERILEKRWGEGAAGFKPETKI